jgi:hypothetical protein
MFVAMYIAYPRVDHIYLGRLLPIIFNIGPRCIIFWYCIVDIQGTDSQHNFLCVTYEWVQLANVSS